MFNHLSEGRWWDVGLQLVEGCTTVSPGCNNCWALTAANMRRFNPNPKTAARYKGTVRAATCNTNWTGQVNPQWKDLDKIGRSRTPKVHTFWNDCFHPGVEEKFITSVMLRIIERPQHFYIICTKRPERALDYFNLCWPDYVREFGPDPFKNRLMLMTTAENQDMAGLRLPVLLQIPGVLHGVSVEPGLSVVDFAKVVCNDGDHLGPMLYNHGADAGLDWVIVGGESGPHARPMHPDIPRQLRDQCQAAGVPFFFKAWGEWRQCDEPQETFSHKTGDFQTLPAEQCFKRVGKKAAGRLLDGRTWDEAPEITP